MYPEQNGKIKNVKGEKWPISPEENGKIEKVRGELSQFAP